MSDDRTPTRLRHLSKRIDKLEKRIFGRLEALWGRMLAPFVRNETLPEGVSGVYARTPEGMVPLWGSPPLGVEPAGWLSERELETLQGGSGGWLTSRRIEEEEEEPEQQASDIPVYLAPPALQGAPNADRLWQTVQKIGRILEGPLRTTKDVKWAVEKVRRIVESTGRGGERAEHEARPPSERKRLEAEWWELWEALTRLLYAHDDDFASDHDAAVKHGHKTLNRIVRRGPQPYPEEEAPEVASAVMFVLIRDGRVLMERCPKKAKHFDGEWFIPGGRIEPGESVGGALAREVAEELGERDVQVEYLGIVDATSPGADRPFLMRAFLLSDWTGEIPETTRDHGYDLRWVPLEEARRSSVKAVRAALALAAPAPHREPTERRKTWDLLLEDAKKVRDGEVEPYWLADTWTAFIHRPDKKEVEGRHFYAVEHWREMATLMLTDLPEYEGLGTRRVIGPDRPVPVTLLPGHVGEDVSPPAEKGWIRLNIPEPKDSPATILLDYDPEHDVWVPRGIWPWNEEGGTADPRDGVTLIAAERRRQIEEEGYTPEHDLGHDEERELLTVAHEILGEFHPRLTQDPDDIWGLLAKHSRRPDGEMRLLVIAGALIAAEIDRIRGTAPVREGAPEVYGCNCSASPCRCGGVRR